MICFLNNTIENRVILYRSMNRFVKKKQYSTNTMDTFTLWNKVLYIIVIPNLKKIQEYVKKVFGVFILINLKFLISNKNIKHCSPAEKVSGWICARHLFTYHFGGWGKLKIFRLGVRSFLIFSGWLSPCLMVAIF